MPTLKSLMMPQHFMLDSPRLLSPSQIWACWHNVYDILTGLARTVIGALTTTFTAPRQCNAAFVYSHPSWLSLAYLVSISSHSSALHLFIVSQTQTCNPTSYWTNAEATVCWPPATYGATPTSTPFGGWGFYSPGLMCPAGRTAACSATGGGSWEWPVQYSMYNAETAYGCCPRSVLAKPYVELC